MRYYMVDPDNEERLLKIPPHVRDAIRAEALNEAWKAVHNLEFYPVRIEQISRQQALDAIYSLMEK